MGSVPLVEGKVRYIRLCKALVFQMGLFCLKEINRWVLFLSCEGR